MTRCANPVIPTGGPKDEKPPAVLAENPPNYSRNFSSDRIIIEFDEFIALENISKNLMVSPPLSEAPQVKTKGKSLEIRIRDTLKTNTTYTLYFSQAIADITESNKIGSYSYVFSTGDSIDMGGLSGKIKDAFSGEPLQGIAVMLYREYDDSLPMTSRPWYLARTDDKGYYEFRNIADHSYKLFALKDDNANLKYDLPSEMIGFPDSLLKPYVLVADTDSVSMRLHFSAPNAYSTDILLFDEEEEVLRVTRASMGQVSLAEIEFNKRGSGRSARPIGYLGTEPLRQEHARFGDTLRFWIPDPLPDTLLLEVLDNGLPIDTVSILPRRVSSRGRSTSTGTPLLDVIASHSGKKNLPPGLPLVISSNFPVMKPDSLGILLIQGTDTTRPDWHFNDPELMRQIVISQEWAEGTDYSILIMPEWLKGINGLTHDTLRFPFHTGALADYGTLTLNLKPGPALRQVSPVIIQILDNAGKVLHSQWLDPENPQPARFSFLVPGDYRLRAIIDENGNKYWDPGNYANGRQPETVIYHSSPVNVKANWELDLEWEL